MKARLKYAYGSTMSGAVIDYQLAPNMVSGHFFDSNNQGWYVTPDNVEFIYEPVSPDNALCKVFGQQIKRLEVEFHGDGSKTF